MWFCVDGHLQKFWRNTSTSPSGSSDHRLVFHWICSSFKHQPLCSRTTWPTHPLHPHPKLACQPLCPFSTYTRIIQGVLKKTTKLSLQRLYCSLYNILSTVPFKVVPSTGNTPFPTFLTLLECFLERTFCDGAQFSYRIFLNLLYGLETTYFQSGFKFGKQEKVCWG